MLRREVDIGEAFAIGWRTFWSQPGAFVGAQLVFVLVLLLLMGPLR